ncbi:MAG TPA: hypothetical protein PKB10_03155 [Tepidisphaeraceae bacterium]|nr:hypothetical protein [Tepidisphaeraceae bacterium]
MLTSTGALSSGLEEIATGRNPASTTLSVRTDPSPCVAAIPTAATPTTAMIRRTPLPEVRFIFPISFARDYQQTARPVKLNLNLQRQPEPLPSANF